jgi:DNA polymerase-3 subunit epsilon
MRQIVLDTETTGLDPAEGHRIIEIAGVEIMDRRLTGNRFHRYVNPERPVDPGAREVHGLSDEFLADKPRFREVVDEFLGFVSGAELIIHNAPFDVSFLDRELDLIDRPGIGKHCPQITDTLRMARELNPGKRANLDALCERYQIDNSQRTLHGALLDAELLAEVYLAMTRGQDSLVIDFTPAAAAGPLDDEPGGALELVVVRAGSEELAAHEQYLAELDKASGGACLWRELAGKAT